MDIVIFIISLGFFPPYGQTLMILPAESGTGGQQPKGLSLYDFRGVMLLGWGEQRQKWGFGEKE